MKGELQDMDSLCLIVLVLLPEFPVWDKGFLPGSPLLSLEKTKSRKTSEAQLHLPGQIQCSFSSSDPGGERQEH